MNNRLRLCVKRLPKGYIKMITASAQSRTAKPVLIKLTHRERNQLENLAKLKCIPMTTLAYLALSNWLAEQSTDGGAQ